MSYDEIERVWKSPDNRPSPPEAERAHAAFLAALRRERRTFFRRVGLGVALLAILTIGVAVALFRGEPFAREWPALLLLALPWIGATLFIRRQWRHRKAHAEYDQSVAHTLRALLDANRAAQQRVRTMQVLLALSAPVMALCIWRLQAVGKVRPTEAASLATVMTVIILLSAVAVYREYRRLRPEERRLAGLLADFG